MANMIDAEERLNQLNLDLLSAEKRQTLELQKIERLVKKSELQLAKFQEQLRNNELRIHAWMLQKSKSNNPGIKVIPDIYFGVARPISSFTHSKYLVDAPISDMEKWIDLPIVPTLHNMFTRRREIENNLKTSSLETKEVVERKRQVKKQFEVEKKALQSKIKKLETNIALSISKRHSGGRKRASTAPKMDIENWEDAENFAVKYMRWLGFADARKTRAGSDEGKDVESSKAVAQVKDMGTGVSRPMLQQLFGVAAAEKKIPVFFARSYAKTAKEWGQKHEMALFQFSIRGDVKAVSTKAEQILKKKSS
jgi:hypothetical protein